MNSKIWFLFLFFTGLIFSGCQKEPEPKPLPESDYPTTYQPLSQTEWNERNADFQKINIYEGLILNEYGFVEGKIPMNENDSITEEYVTKTIDSLVAVYKCFFGILENIQFDFENELLIEAPYLTPVGRLNIGRFYEDVEKYRNEFLSDNYFDNFKFEYFLTQNKFENRILNGFELAFFFNLDDNLIEISGFWIPEIMIPKEKIYSESDAFTIAYRQILTKKGLDIWEIKEDYHTYPLLLKVKNNNQFEIRDCWCVYTVGPPYVGYSTAVYIDTQTGEVVRYFDRL